MLTFLIAVGSIALIFLCAWLILLILMQKPSANAGMGAALGGGAAESAFGGEASNVLTRWTVFGVIGFFFLTLTLSLGQIYRHHHDDSKKELAPMAEDVPEAPKSLTQLPTDVEKAKNAANEAGSEASKSGSAKLEAAKADVAKQDVAKVDTSKKDSASKTDTSKTAPEVSKVSEAPTGKETKTTDKATETKKKTQISYASGSKSKSNKDKNTKKSTKKGKNTKTKDASPADGTLTR